MGYGYQRLRSRLTLTGHVEAHLFDAKKVPTFEDFLKLKQQNEIDLYAVWKDKGDNLIVNSGLNAIISNLLGNSPLSFLSCGVGSGTNTPTATDTDLQTTITRISVSQTGQSSNVGSWNTFFAGSVGNGTWNESGLFTTNMLGTGTMLCRKLFSSSFAKTLTNTGAVSWQITATAV